MNLTIFCSGNTVYTDVECIKGYSFKAVFAGVKSALLKVNNLTKTAVRSSFTGHLRN